MSPFGRLVKRGRNGRYRLRLDADLRDLLRGIPTQLRELLTHDRDNDALRRLFPPAYVDQPELEAEYQRLMGDDLVQRRLEALELMASTIDAEDLDEDELAAWLSTLHDFRITLGTALDVSDDTFATRPDPADPRLPGLAFYELLTGIESELVAGLTSGLPPPQADR